MSSVRRVSDLIHARGAGKRAAAKADVEGDAEADESGRTRRWPRPPRPLGALRLLSIRELRRRVARTPLWLRLVAGTLLLVALAIALTGGFAVQLLRGYLVDRVDVQLTAFGRRPAEPPVPPQVMGNAFRPPRQFGSFYVVLLDRNGTVIRTVQEPPNADSLPALPTPGRTAGSGSSRSRAPREGCGGRSPYARTTAPASASRPSAWTISTARSPGSR